MLKASLTDEPGEHYPLLFQKSNAHPSQRPRPPPTHALELPARQLYDLVQAERDQLLTDTS